MQYYNIECYRFAIICFTARTLCGIRSADADVMSVMAKSMARLGGLRILSVGPFSPGAMTRGGGLPVLDGARHRVVEAVGAGLVVALRVVALAEEGGQFLVLK